MPNKELIYREDLIAEYDRVHKGPAGGARKLMVDAPAVDAVEVKHGEWINKTKIINGLVDYRYDCSSCGEIFWKSGALIDDFNYCPNCGAKMGGIADD